MSDRQLAGACRLGFQGFGSAGAVRTRAGPETPRAPPWTLGAGSLKNSFNPCYRFKAQSLACSAGKHRKKLPCEFGRDCFLFQREKVHLQTQTGSPTA